MSPAHAHRLAPRGPQRAAEARFRPATCHGNRPARRWLLATPSQAPNRIICALQVSRSRSASRRAYSAGNCETWCTSHGA